MNRRYLPHAKRGSGHQQGRPMGSLLAWLLLPCEGNMQQHKAAYTEAQLPHEMRVEARLWGMGVNGLEFLFERERSVYPQEDAEEPVRLA